jgi:hypothetical protein
LTKSNNQPKIKSPISKILSKFTRLVKKQENMTHNKENNQSIETDPEMTQMIKLAEQTLKSYYKYTSYDKESGRYTT